jgi:hypothetical protein
VNQPMRSWRISHVIMPKSSMAGTAAMSATRIPAVPGGLRAGQLGVIVIGRVIMGDIAVTLVDLAQRKMLTLAGTGDDDDWLLTPIFPDITKLKFNP